MYMHHFQLNGKIICKYKKKKNFVGRNIVVKIGMIITVKILLFSKLYLADRRESFFSLQLFELNNLSEKYAIV